jgi:hypothetical protein
MFLNMDYGCYRDATVDYGVQDGGWGWGTVLFDFDLDGYLDLALTNGIKYCDFLGFHNFETTDAESVDLCARYNVSCTGLAPKTNRLWRNAGAFGS